MHTKTRIVKVLTYIYKFTKNTRIYGRICLDTHTHTRARAYRLNLTSTNILMYAHTYLLRMFVFQRAYLYLLTYFSMWETESCVCVCACRKQYSNTPRTCLLMREDVALTCLNALLLAVISIYSCVNICVYLPQHRKMVGKGHFVRRVSLSSPSIERRYKKGEH